MGEVLGSFVVSLPKMLAPTALDTICLACQCIYMYIYLKLLLSELINMGQILPLLLLLNSGAILQINLLPVNKFNT